MAVCVPALSLSVPTAVFLRLSLNLLPVLSNPSTPLTRPAPWPVDCRWVFLTTGPSASAAPPSPSPFFGTFVTGCSGLSRQ